MDSSKSWKQFQDYTDYYISSCGDVYSCNIKTCLKQFIADDKSYPIVRISKNGEQKTFAVHRLVAVAHIPNPNNFRDVNHKDGNKLHNHVDNLEWTPHSENMLHSRRVLLNKGKPKVPITIVKGDEELTFERTKEAQHYLGCCGWIFKEFKEGVRQVKGYSIKK
jgi:hypothetical protein